MNAIPLGVYVPGTSLIHRMPPGWKFVLLIGFILGSALLANSVLLALGTVLIPLLGYLIARIPGRIAWGQLWPPLPILAALGLFHWWQQGPELALTTVLVIFSAVMSATLLTLTTTIPELMDAVERALSPLRRFGVPVETISLAISLTIRLIPLQLATVREVLDARKARGATLSITAFGTPVLIRSLRRARAMGEALRARGVGD